jgi:hypothetical protein
VLGIQSPTPNPFSEFIHDEERGKIAKESKLFLSDPMNKSLDNKEESTYRKAK